MKLITFALVFKVCLVNTQQTSWSRLIIDGPSKISENIELIYTPSNYNAIILQLKDLPFLMSSHEFNVSRSTMIYFPGWVSSEVPDLSSIAIRSAYNNMGDHNVITVDWSFYANKNLNYRTEVLPQIKIIAEAFAEQLRDFVNSGYNISKLHLVGHSLGAQMAGKVGRHLRKISNEKLMIPRIYALDPTGPGFEDNIIEGFEAISENDASYVQVIHSCAGFLGMQHKAGSADFYPNGGSHQPSCEMGRQTNNFMESCDHSRAWQLYQESLKSPDAFPAIRCNSWDDFLFNGTCEVNEVTYMGFGAHLKSRGKFFLETNGNLFNFSKGFDGISSMRVNVSRLLTPNNDGNLPLSNKAHNVLF